MDVENEVLLRPTGYYERPHHPGNVFWSQSLQAARLYAALTVDQRNEAARESLPEEGNIHFSPKPRGLAALHLNVGQQQLLSDLVDSLLDPFRARDQARVRRCLESNGGLEALSIAFGRSNRMSAPDWDDWRLEGPAFIWHFRGYPHVHVWVHVADGADVEANARLGTFIFPGHATLE